MNTYKFVYKLNDYENRCLSACHILLDVEHILWFELCPVLSAPILTYPLFSLALLMISTFSHPGLVFLI